MITYCAHTYIPHFHALILDFPSLSFYACFAPVSFGLKKEKEREEKKPTVSLNRVTRDSPRAPTSLRGGWSLLSVMPLSYAVLPWRHSDQAGQKKIGARGSKTIISEYRGGVITLNNSHRAGFAHPPFRSR